MPEPYKSMSMLLKAKHWAKFMVLPPLIVNRKKEEKGEIKSIIKFSLISTSLSLFTFKKSACQSLLSP
jgi:hypothetical protein